MVKTSQRFILSSAAVLVLLCGLTAPLSAAAVLPDTLYRLLDHPDGALTQDPEPNPQYGLRYDHAPDGSGGTVPRVFSFELGTADVQAFWKTVASATPQPVDTLRIWGTVVDNTDNTAGNGAPGDVWDLEFTAPTCFSVAGGVECNSLVPGPGYGTVTRAGFPALTITLFAKSDGTHTFRLVGDGHRLAGDTTSEVGRGWVNPAGTACCDDFLFRATPVPEPSSLLLLGSGLVLGLCVVRKRFAA